MSTEISSGQQYHEWTVLEYHSYKKGAGAYWLCRCSCGTTKPVRATNLRKGHSTRCKGCTILPMKSRTENLIGRVFGQWTVLEMDTTAKRRGAYWLSECSCDSRSIVRAKDLRQGTSTKCKKCSRPKRQYADGLPNWFWTRLVHTAKKRQKQLTVTQTQCYDKLISQNFSCALSGLPIDLPKSQSEYKEHGSTASLDRIDSEQGYTEDNIQWVHKDVNFMKQQFSMKYFLELCKKISDHDVR